MADRGGAATAGPSKRNTTPSGSTRHTQASIAPGSSCGTVKYSRPFVASAKAARSVSLTANLIQPSRFSGSSIAVDHIAETVPTPTVTFIGTYASCRFCIGQINSQRGIAKCSVARVRYPVDEEGMMEILLVVWFGRFRGLAGE